MQEWFDVLFDGVSRAVSWLKSIQIFDGVTLWSFILTCIILGIVLTCLVNVVRSQVRVSPRGLTRASRRSREGGDN